MSLELNLEEYKPLQIISSAKLSFQFSMILLREDSEFVVKNSKELFSNDMLFQYLSKIYKNYLCDS